jgi:hypothetical protein
VGTLTGGIIAGFLGGLIWGALAICALKRGKPIETTTPFQTYLETSKGWYVPIVGEINGRYGRRDVDTGGRLNGGRGSTDIESGWKVHEGEGGQSLGDTYSIRGARLGHEVERERPSINSSSEQLENWEDVQHSERLVKLERQHSEKLEKSERVEITERQESLEQQDNSGNHDNLGIEHREGDG